MGPFALFGGEAGIRTLGGLQTLNGFQDRRFQPLSHLSKGAKDTRLFPLQQGFAASG